MAEELEGPPAHDFLLEEGDCEDAGDEGCEDGGGVAAFGEESGEEDGEHACEGEGHDAEGEVDE